MKYHVPTGFAFSPKASGFYPFGGATDLVRGRRCLKSQTKGTVLLVCICQRHTKRTVPLVCDLWCG
ncbi:MAG: hypothetical protein SPF86_01825 [Sodaliphilus sp.]|nr:hypothetical protein [Sodaliphilus sp.]